jgi:hypothetical protein
LESLKVRQKIVPPADAIPDFSNWKDHDSYQTAFQRLVKDLKAEAGG